MAYDLASKVRKLRNAYARRDAKGHHWIEIGVAVKRLDDMLAAQELHDRLSGTAIDNGLKVRLTPNA